MEWRHFVTYLWNDPRTTYCTCIIVACEAVKCEHCVNWLWIHVT